MLTGKEVGVGYRIIQDVDLKGNLGRLSAETRVLNWVQLMTDRISVSMTVIGQPEQKSLINQFKGWALPIGEEMSDNCIYRS